MPHTTEQRAETVMVITLIPFGATLLMKYSGRHMINVTAQRTL